MSVLTDGQSAHVEPNSGGISVGVAPCACPGSPLIQASSGNHRSNPRGQAQGAVPTRYSLLRSYILSIDHC